jgi:hypothetical protein
MKLLVLLSILVRLPFRARLELLHCALVRLGHRGAATLADACLLDAIELIQEDGRLDAAA